VAEKDEREEGAGKFGYEEAGLKGRMWGCMGSMCSGFMLWGRANGRRKDEEEDDNKQEDDEAKDACGDEDPQEIDDEAVCLGLLLLLSLALHCRLRAVCVGRGRRGKGVCVRWVKWRMCGTTMWPPEYEP
jgi:hypothetical protein